MPSISFITKSDMFLTPTFFDKKDQNLLFP